MDKATLRIQRMEKDRYRRYILTVSPWISLSAVLGDMTVQRSNLTSFLNGRDAAIKIETLQEIKDRCDQMVARLNEAADEFARIN